MIRAFGQYAQNQSDYSVLVDQINKINSQINVVVNKYNSISNDIFSVSSNISTFNENLNRVTVELNNINQSIHSLESEISKVSNSNYSLAYYITDPVLTTSLYLYNNYSTFDSTTDIVIFEPYVRSVPINYLEGRDFFKYNLCNATIYDTQTTDGLWAYSGLTCDEFSAKGLYLTSGSINTYYGERFSLLRCSGQSLFARYATFVDCEINSIELQCLQNVPIANAINIVSCNVKYAKNDGVFRDCLIMNHDLTRANFDNCTLLKYLQSNARYNNMEINSVRDMVNCTLSGVSINNAVKELTLYSFENCSFNGVSFYHLTHTNFINCSGDIYIPRLINGKNMFDNNNQYLGGLPTNQTLNTSSTYTLTNTNSYTIETETNIDTSSTYTGKYTYNDISTSYLTIDTTTNYTYIPATNTNTVLESTTNTTMYDTYTTLYDGEVWTATRTDFIPIIKETTGTLTDNYQIPSLTILDITDTITNTLTDNYTTQITYDPVLTVNILPEWRTPNLFTNNIINTQYINTFIDIDYYTESIEKFELNDCTGNIMMYVDSISSNFIIANNNLYKCELNLGDYGSQFIITANNIKNLDLYLNSNDTPGFTMSMNNIDKMNLLYNFTANSSIIFEKNSFKDFNINAAAKGNLRMSSCTINNGKLYGWNGLYYCEANYIENYGENSYSKNTINTLRAHNIKLMYDNIIDKLIIEPNQYESLSFYGNSIKTLICPSYFPVSASAAMNTFNTIIAY